MRYHAAMSKKTRRLEAVLVLVDIRSVHNVGAIFRTADAAGVEKIFCAGYTPTPTDRFGRVRADIKKTALGAEESVPWEAAPRIGTLIKRLKKEGYTILVLEQDPRAVDYKKIKLKGKVALLVGNETEGIPGKVLDICDTIIEIPMAGKKESLNVSVATGVALFRILGI
ncbi:MAG: hypothetical protein A2675_04170 [Candidatus Yonathbacteria bacterium RIFCSPHIGHO2_01_FULL_51_10]|uniref:tRNA/rRNA methyltransferase SpoU type domain-containing protein n=1 Tax=Candidatus Yonathbacteria bacterium RIFCSPHIGHO2_01_FULL_51_10 TaxID=1802723 RepID=A0A1G2S3W9_9BACT|nr:MAG: hypothetical protein A2675_04170 [Candidatus Yonathbacteria bacterium RIFCSPHIGHO2_01_FULL_51_10]